MNVLRVERQGLVGEAWNKILFLHKIFLWHVICMEERAMTKIGLPDSNTGVDPAARYATDAEVELADWLRHRLEERYLGSSDSPSDMPVRADEVH